MDIKVPTAPETAARQRLVKDPIPNAPLSDSAAERFSLREGGLYRISYAIGNLTQRRVSRSVATFDGESERRNWRGDVINCLDFSLPRGRTLSLVSAQLIDIRAAELNERGQCILAEEGALRRRGGRRD